MAADPLLFTRLGRPIPETRMQVADVELLEPPGDGIGQFKGAAPLPQPHAFLLERADAALGVGVALGIVVAGEGLRDPQLATGTHEGDRGGLAAIVRHQVQAVPPHAVRELAVNGHVKRHQPMLSRALQADMVAHVLLGVPVEHHDYVDPAEALDQDLRHVDAPPLVRGGRLGLVPRRGSRGTEAQVRLDEQAGLVHHAPDALLVDGSPST